jgi:hypothetical protein
LLVAAFGRRYGAARSSGNLIQSLATMRVLHFEVDPRGGRGAPTGGQRAWIIGRE